MLRFFFGSPRGTIPRDDWQQPLQTRRAVQQAKIEIVTAFGKSYICKCNSLGTDQTSHTMYPSWSAHYVLPTATLSLYNSFVDR